KQENYCKLQRCLLKKTKNEPITSSPEGNLVVLRCLLKCSFLFPAFLCRERLQHLRQKNKGACFLLPTRLPSLKHSRFHENPSRFYMQVYNSNFFPLPSHLSQSAYFFFEKATGQNTVSSQALTV